jgi:hypothetical protein
MRTHNVADRALMTGDQDEEHREPPRAPRTLLVRADGQGDRCTRLERDILPQPSEPTVTRSSPPFRTRWVVLGLLLVELGWIVALPPFRGVDEHDHAFRASAVAHGQWIAPPAEATRGTGAFVLVEPDIVAAAAPECLRRPYTVEADCRGTAAGNRVEIASGAGRYHPLFYAVVGAPTLVLEGEASLYAMRLVALLLCLGMATVAVRALRSWADPMVAVAVLCGLTPVVLYSMSLVAPNGLELMSGLALWASLGAIASSEGPVRRGHVLAAVIAAAVLLTLRSLGPLWVLLVGVTALIVWPSLAPRLWSLRRSLTGLVAALALALVAAGSLWWIFGQDSMVVGRAAALPEITASDRMSVSAGRIPQWILQMVAAFPSRSEPAPPVVYAAFLSLLGFLIGFAIWRGKPRLRVALTVAIVASLVVPFCITVATLDEFGTAWQGRYGLPYLLGAAVLFGIPLATLGHRARLMLVGAAFPLVVIGHAVSMTAVLERERRESPLSGTDAWSLAPSPVLLVALVAGGWALAFLPLAHRAVTCSREAA